MSYRQRKSPRLPGYDYTQAGMYFVTLVTIQRLSLFGTITADYMVTSPLGTIARIEINQIPNHWSGWVDVDAFVVMPNHVHMIIILHDQESRDGTRCRPLSDNHHRPLSDDHRHPPTLGHVVGAYKGGVTSKGRINELIDRSPWQTCYHDHVIRNEKDLNRIRSYIAQNPARWATDKFYTSK